MTAINTVLLLFSALSLFLDSFLYPSASLRYLGIDSKIVFSIFASYTLLLRFFTKDLFPTWIVKINRTVILPTLVLSLILFVVLENVNYHNFVFNTFHFYPENFLFLTGLSGFLIYLGILRPKSSSEAFVSKYAYYIGPIILIFLAYLNLVNPGIFLRLVKEDGMVESLQFLMYFGAVIFSLLIAKRFIRLDKRIFFFYLVLGIGLLFVSMEEISWGQRLIGFKTPAAVTEINYQNETTLHNIRPVQDSIHFAYIGIGLLGVFGNLVLKILRFPKKLALYFAPAPYLSFYFLMIALYFTLHKYLHNYYELGSGRQVSVPRWQEISEAFLALGLLFFALTNYLRNRRGFRIRR